MQGREENQSTLAEMYEMKPRDNCVLHPILKKTLSHVDMKWKP